MYLFSLFIDMIKSSQYTLIWSDKPACPPPADKPQEV